MPKHISLDSVTFAFDEHQVGTNAAAAFAKQSRHTNDSKANFSELKTCSCLNECTSLSMTIHFESFFGSRFGLNGILQIVQSERIELVESKVIRGQSDI